MTVDSGTAATRVPVEHRFLGLDRRSFPHAFFVIAVFLVATVVIPRIDDAIDWDDPVAAGDVLALSDKVVFTPTTGWDVESGFRVEGDTPSASGEAVVVSNGVVVDVRAGDFDGTPAQLVDQIAKVTSSTDDSTFEVDGDPRTITTSSGEVGVIQGYSSVRGDGLVAAFVIDGTGVEVTAFGPPEQMTAAADDLAEMVASIRSLDGSDA